MSLSLKIPKSLAKLALAPIPTEVYSKACKPCPSMQLPHDPEMLNILECVRRGEDPKEYMFTCAWRQKKLCRGNYDCLMEAKP